MAGSDKNPAERGEVFGKVLLLSEKAKMPKTGAPDGAKRRLSLKISEYGYFFEKSRRDGLQNVPRRNIMQNCARIHADPAGAAAGRIR